MKRLELFLFVIAIISLILKLLNFPPSSMFLFFSLLILGGMYFYLGFAFFNNIALKEVFKSNSYKGIKSIQIVASVGLGCGLSILIIGVLFEILRYPMSRLFLIIGIIFSLAFLTLFVLTLLNERRGEIKSHLLRGLSLVSIGLILLLIPEYSIEKIQYRNQPELLEIILKLD